MLEIIRRLFATDFMPHIYCLRDPALVAIHAGSDGLIALSYFAIPVALLLLIRWRRDPALAWGYVLFIVFILACGATHVLGIVTLWIPVYRLEGAVKAFTALASASTAILLLCFVPRIAAFPGPDQFRHELEERKRAEQRVAALNAELENRVRERTLELEAANQNLAELAAALDKAQTIIQKLDGTIVFWNSGAESLYGWSREEALGRKSHELLKTQLPRSLAEIQSELLQHGSWSGEFRQRCRDGSVIWVASHWILHRRPDETVSVVKVNSDITALKRAVDALRASEARSRSLFENAGQGLLTAASDGRILDANSMVEELFGYRKTELIGSPVEMLLPDSLRSRHGGHRAQYALQPHTRRMGVGLDLVGRRKDGSEFPVEISLSHVGGNAADDGMPDEPGVSIAFISDITARQQASREREDLIARLESAIGEKTVLLKEVHHRVKNNLAVIAGLLEMQAAALADDKARSALAESQRRVLSMALIHEYLYSTEHLDRVNFGQYVQQLAAELSNSYAIHPNVVAVSIETEEVDLAVHRAIPCALILNELLSNALKYAFPHGRKGEIRVRFSRAGGDQLFLSCQDNGVGVPETVNFQNPQSLGLRIAGILTKQIDGRLILNRAGGTCFELCFSEGKH